MNSNPMSSTSGPHPMDSGTIQPFLGFLKHARWVIAHYPEDFMARFRPPNMEGRRMIGVPGFDEHGVLVKFLGPGNDPVFASTVLVPWSQFLRFYRIYQ